MKFRQFIVFIYYSFLCILLIFSPPPHPSHLFSSSAYSSSFLLLCLLFIFSPPSPLHLFSTFSFSSFLHLILFIFSTTPPSFFPHFTFSSSSSQSIIFNFSTKSNYFLLHCAHFYLKNRRKINFLLQFIFLGFFFSYLIKIKYLALYSIELRLLD